MKKLFCLAIVAVAMVACVERPRSGNPIIEGWYADPEGVIFGDTYWLYPTWSQKFVEQLHFDAFSSKDLVHWQKHERIVDNNSVKWINKALWAPSIIEKDGRYFLFFSANDVHEGEVGGIGIAVADNPAGPFEDYLGKPLINDIINGAQQQ